MLKSLFKRTGKHRGIWDARTIFGASHSSGSTSANQGAEEEEPDPIKLFASEFLAALSGKQIDRIGIRFTGSDPHDSGGKGDVLVATPVLEDHDTVSQEGITVAVKKLRFSPLDDKKSFLLAFRNELRVLDKISHPHIVKLLGFVEEIENGIAWMVFPWESNGNVREFLRSGEWHIPERVSLIKDVASGLEYLHSRQPPIRHGDLKSLNILVDSSYRAIITDFGSARVVKRGAGVGKGPSVESTAATNQTSPKDRQSSQISVSIANNQLNLTGPGWSFRWAAPEVLNGELLELGSDIWALGWICWEVITDNYPFPDASGPGSITLMVIKGQLPSIYEDDQLSQIRELCHVMTECWKLKAKERPSASRCNQILRWLASVVPKPKDTAGDKIRSAALLNTLGEMHRLGLRYEQASEMLEEALVIAKSTQDKPAIARALVNLGNIHRVRSNYSAAEESINQALDIYTNNGDSQGKASAFHRRTALPKHRISMPRREITHDEQTHCIDSDKFTKNDADTPRRRSPLPKHWPSMHVSGMTSAERMRYVILGRFIRSSFSMTRRRTTLTEHVLFPPALETTLGGRTHCIG